MLGSTPSFRPGFLVELSVRMSIGSFILIKFSSLGFTLLRGASEQATHVNVDNPIVRITTFICQTLRSQVTWLFGRVSGRVRQ